MQQEKQQAQLQLRRALRGKAGRQVSLALKKLGIEDRSLLTWCVRSAWLAGYCYSFPYLPSCLLTVPLAFA